MCELQPVTVEEDAFKKNAEQQKREHVLTDLNLDQDQILTDTVFLSARSDLFVANNDSDYISDLRKRMEETRQVVQQHLEKTKTKQAKYYNRKAKTIQISVGDQVLVRRVAFNGKHKLADTYKDDIYTVVCQMNPDVPVYRVRSGGNEKVLHRNFSLPGLLSGSG